MPLERESDPPYLVIVDEIALAMAAIDIVSRVVESGQPIFVRRGDKVAAVVVALGTERLSERRVPEAM